MTVDRIDPERAWQPTRATDKGFPPQLPDAQRIDPILVEKVRDAVREVLRNEEALVDYSERGAIETCEDVAQAAIKVVVDELPPLDRISFLSGYIVACSDRASGVFPGNDAAVKTFAERAWKQTGVSDWRPVEQGDVDGD